MGSSALYNGIVLRLMALTATIAALMWVMMNTGWYLTSAVLTAASATQVFFLLHFATQTNRQLARFLEAISFDDATLTFGKISTDPAYQELGLAMNRVLEHLRIGRSQQEEILQYLQALIAHVPVALLAVDRNGKVQLLNLAARRLFEGPCASLADFARYGESFAAGMNALRSGESLTLKMERAWGSLQLKAAATDFSRNITRLRLISLQNIENELNTQELVAWQTVIRVMAHEVMNSLTPISSLASTVSDVIDDTTRQMKADDPVRASLTDAQDALQTMKRRSEGLLHFVENQRRLSKHMVAEKRLVPARGVFSRLQRLLADDLAARNIRFFTNLEPEMLEIAVDVELLDQALINLVRNAMEAVQDKTNGRITLSGSRDVHGRSVIAVADNGPGIPLDHREKVFVPFFTTKKQGSGVGLTLTRQIAAAHNATISIGETDGGGTTIILHF